MRHVEIYTDGSYKNGIGGAASIIKTRKHIKQYSWHINKATSSEQSEITAILLAMRMITNAKQKTIIYTDFNMVVDGFENERFVYKWRENDWYNNGKTIPYAGIWSEILSIYEKCNISFVWVKGHSKCKENKMCDRLAKTAAKITPTKENDFFIL